MEKHISLVIKIMKNEITLSCSGKESETPHPKVYFVAQIGEQVKCTYCGITLQYSNTEDKSS